MFSVLGLASSAAAQATVTGQATGAAITLGGTQIVGSADTGEKSASCSTGQCSFDPNPTTASGAAVPAAPIAEILTGESMTAGTADNNADVSENETAVSSVAGDAVAAVLPSADGSTPAVLDVVTSGASVTLACAENPVFSGGVEVLELNGEPVLNFPADQEITVLTDEFPLLRINREECETPNETSITCEKTGVDVQVIPTVADIARVILSRATASMSNVPEDCICPPGDVCFPCRNLTRSTIDGDFDPAGECPAIAEAGDRLNVEIDVVNSSAETCEPLTVSVITRIDPELDIDEESVMVGGAPAVGTIDACPSDVEFSGCEGDDPGPDPECLTVDVGAVAPGESTLVEFSGVVNNDGAAICVNARILRQGAAGPIVDKELTFFVPSGDCGSPISPSDILQTTGGGGCTIGATGARATLDLWPVLSFTAMLVAWRSLRRRSR